MTEKKSAEERIAAALRFLESAKARLELSPAGAMAQYHYNVSVGKASSEGIKSGIMEAAVAAAEWVHSQKKG